MTNADVARIFDEVADLLEISGDDSFRVNTYRRVARTLGDLTADLRELVARGELESLPGVGKGSAARIRELLATGRLALRDELTAKVPPGLLELLRIPHLGPKKVALLWKERGIASLDQLRAALDGATLVGVKGLGPKSIEQIREGLDFLARTSGRTRLSDAFPLAEVIRRLVGDIDGVRRVEHAGSLRRGCETVGDLDLLCVADDGARVVAEFARLPQVSKVLVAGDTKGSILAEYAAGRLIQVDLRVVPEQSFGAAWQYFTGSKQHNVRLREMAVKRGWSLNEYALSEGDRVLASRQEEDIYAALGLPWYPPELREDRGEFDLQTVPRDLLTLDDVRGDLHMHTTASDGRSSIEEMVSAAKALNYEYVCITDHSQSSVIANGLKPDRLKAHAAEVRRVAARTKGIRVLVGAEVDILGDGALDYDDATLAALDFVVASVHTGQSQDVDRNTRRTLAAVRNRYVNLIAHPTGRLLGKRDAMPLDVEAVAREAARNGTALEINASPLRLDLKDTHARAARDAGTALCIDTDSHSADGLQAMAYGVWTARRAGLRRGDVLNTRPVDEVLAFVAAKRRK